MTQPEWTCREWYPILKRGKDIHLIEDWVLYQSSENTVEMIHYTGEVARAEVEDDGVCRARASPEFLPLPVEVKQVIKVLLNY